MSKPLRVNPITPLELTMREVLDSLEDLASDYAYRSVPGCFEILSIEPPAADYTRPLPAPTLRAVGED